MGRIWDFLMRRKPLMFGFLLLFIVSAAFSSVYLRPLFRHAPMSSSPSVVVPAEPMTEPEPEPTPESEPVVSVAISALSPAEVVALSETVAIPRTNLSFAIPGNIIKIESLTQTHTAEQLSPSAALKIWHSIVSGTTGALVLGAVAISCARLLTKNLLK